jgi:hypothetical protein
VVLKPRSTATGLRTDSAVSTASRHGPAHSLRWLRFRTGVIGQEISRRVQTFENWLTLNQVLVQQLTGHFSSPAGRGEGAGCGPCQIRSRVGVLAWESAVRRIQRLDRGSELRNEIVSLPSPEPDDALGSVSGL